MGIISELLLFTVSEYSMLLEKLLSTVPSAATSRTDVPVLLQGYLCCTKTTPDCISRPQVSERSLVKHSKNKSNIVASVFLKTLRFTP